MADQITCELFDTVADTVVAGVEVRLYADGPNGWQRIAQRHSDGRGRIDAWPGARFDSPLEAGNYKLHVESADYFAGEETPAFYSAIELPFALGGDGAGINVRISLSATGYSVALQPTVHSPENR